MARINTLYLHLMILSFLILGADGYYSYIVTSCVFSSYDLTDLEYINSYYFNNILVVRFSSTEGKFLGYTERGAKNAGIWNNDPNILAHQRSQRDRYCKPIAEIDIKNILTKTVEPKVKLSLEKKAGNNNPAILLCSVYDFYPKQISVSWLRDGKPVTTDVTTTDVMANGDWYYQVHTRLGYTPKCQEKISCVVEHASFKEPKVYDWHGSDDYKEVCSKTETS